QGFSGNRTTPILRGGFDTSRIFLASVMKRWSMNNCLRDPTPMGPVAALDVAHNSRASAGRISERDPGRDLDIARIALQGSDDAEVVAAQRGGRRVEVHAVEEIRRFEP